MLSPSEYGGTTQCMTQAKEFLQAHGWHDTSIIKADYGITWLVFDAGYNTVHEVGEMHFFPNPPLLICDWFIQFGEVVLVYKRNIWHI